MADEMKDSPTGAAEKIRKSSDYVFWGIGLAVSLILIAYTSYFGFYVNLDRSENPEDWVHFSAIFSNILSPCIASIVLWFVVRSYYLQKAEFEGVRDNLAVQLEVDSNLRRQASLVEEARNICSLIESKWLNRASYSRKDYDTFGMHALTRSDLFVPGEKIITVEMLAKHISKRAGAGDFNGETPVLPGDLNYVRHLLKILDSILEKIVLVDSTLGAISSSLNDGYHQAVIWSINPRVSEIADVYRKIGFFETVNVDVLKHF